MTSKIIFSIAYAVCCFSAYRSAQDGDTRLFLLSWVVACIFSIKLIAGTKPTLPLNTSCPECGGTNESWIDGKPCQSLHAPGDLEKAKRESFHTFWARWEETHGGRDSWMDCTDCRGTGIDQLCGGQCQTCSFPGVIQGGNGRMIIRNNAHAKFYSGRQILWLWVGTARNEDLRDFEVNGVLWKPFARLKFAEATPRNSQFPTSLVYPPSADALYPYSALYGDNRGGPPLPGCE